VEHVLPEEPEEEENTMRPLSKWSFPTGAAVLIAALLLGLFVVQPARADVVLDPNDPAVTARYSTSLGAGVTDGGMKTSFSWSLTSGLVQDTSSHYVSFLNSTGVAWTTLEITAYYTPTTGKTFIAYTGANASPGSSSAFAVATPNSSVSMTGPTEIFSYSGGTGVAAGDYLAFTYTNWNTINGSVLTGFSFKVNGGDPPAVPEPSTLLLLGSGLLGLVGYGRKRMKK
jgi:hypothetical protein